MTVTYQEYNSLCEKWREKVPVETTETERRLIWLSLAASKAQLKEYDQKKGLNQ